MLLIKKIKYYPLLLRTKKQISQKPHFKCIATFTKIVVTYKLMQNSIEGIKYNKTI